MFHVIAPWRATVGESCVKAPIRRRLHGSEPDRGFCTGIAKGLICDFRHAESLERKSPAGAGLEACPSGKAPLLILGGLTEKRSPNRNRAEAR